MSERTMAQQIGRVDTRLKGFGDNVQTVEIGGDVYVLRVICRADEDGKALDALSSMGFRQGQRTGRA